MSCESTQTCISTYSRNGEVDASQDITHLNSSQNANGLVVSYFETMAYEEESDDAVSVKLNPISVGQNVLSFIMSIIMNTHNESACFYKCANDCSLCLYIVHQVFRL